MSKSSRCFKSTLKGLGGDSSSASFKRSQGCYEIDCSNSDYMSVNIYQASNVLQIKCYEWDDGVSKSVAGFEGAITCVAPSKLCRTQYPSTVVCTTGANGESCGINGTPSGTFTASENTCSCSCRNSYTGSNCETAPSQISDCSPSDNTAIATACRCVSSSSTADCTKGSFCWSDNTCNTKPRETAPSQISDCSPSDNTAIATACRCVSSSSTADCTKGSFCWSDNTCNTKRRVAKVYVLSLETEITGIAPEEFNSNTKMIEAFKSTVAKLLDGVSAENVFNVVAKSANRRLLRLLAGMSRSIIEYKVKITSKAQAEIAKTKISNNVEFTGELKTQMESNGVKGISTNAIQAEMKGEVVVEEKSEEIVNGEITKSKQQQQQQQQNNPDIKPESGEDDDSGGTIAAVLSTVVIFLIGAGIGGFLYYRKKHQEVANQPDQSDTIRSIEMTENPAIKAHGCSEASSTNEPASKRIRRLSGVMKARRLSESSSSTTDSSAKKNWKKLRTTIRAGNAFSKPASKRTRRLSHVMKSRRLSETSRSKSKHGADTDSKELTLPIKTNEEDLDNEKGGSVQLQTETEKPEDTSEKTAQRSNDDELALEVLVNEEDLDNVKVGSVQLQTETEKPEDMSEKTAQKSNKDEVAHEFLANEEDLDNEKDGSVQLQSETAKPEDASEKTAQKSNKDELALEVLANEENLDNEKDKAN
jgi:hypothetical protein